MTLRQLTTCSSPATHVLERRGRRRDRTYDYVVHACARHRWLTDSWKGSRRVVEEGQLRCGVVFEHRDYAEVLRSHSWEWVGRLTFHDLEDDHQGDVVGWLRAAFAELSAPGRSAHEGVRVALGHAVLAATVEQDPAVTEAAVLTALAVAETARSATGGDLPRPLADGHSAKARTGFGPGLRAVGAPGAAVRRAVAPSVFRPARLGAAGSAWAIPRGAAGPAQRCGACGPGTGARRRSAIPCSIRADSARARAGASSRAWASVKR
ncbi:hypothetical protein [Kitasatospora sp. NPDC088548]|uniref:hypothetical protein n=1 Tax=Kitasatospora sp. NPDC088548 TaxID=3364075 RepID=UPI00382A43A9